LRDLILADENQRLADIMDERVVSVKLDGSARARKLLETCAAEVDVPMYYDHHSICERLNITPGRVDDVVESLCKSGYKSSRTHFADLA